MNEIVSVNLRSFRQKVRHNKSKFRRFLTKLEKDSPRNLPSLLGQLEKAVWKEVACLGCGNCCKTMTPRFNLEDQKRISAHLDMTVTEFREKWLHREKGGDRDWLNRSEPCQFLDMKDNKCSIYEVRPADCAGYPHLTKNLHEYGHVHKQNLECCPASYRLVEKMMMKFADNN